MKGFSFFKVVFYILKRTVCSAVTSYWRTRLDLLCAAAAAAAQSALHVQNTSHQKSLLFLKRHRDFMLQVIQQQRSPNSVFCFLHGGHFADKSYVIPTARCLLNIRWILLTVSHSVFSIKTRKMAHLTGFSHSNLSRRLKGIKSAETCTEKCSLAVPTYEAFLRINWFFRPLL